MDILFINDKTFKKFRDTKYYCDENGNIYSDYSHKMLKHLYRKNGNKKYAYIDINFKDGKGQVHMPIHRIVYETWIGNISDEMFVLHKDDDSLNNNINNLYLGNQKQNISDCIKNEHRVGNVWVFTVYDSEKDETLTFCPASDFIKYCGHSSANGSIKRFFDKQWFNKRYKIISYYRCKNLSELRRFND